MSSPHATDAARRRDDAAALLGPAAAAVLLSLVGLQGRWLWYDELISVSQSMHGPWSTLLTVMRFDVHPPLYYLQLSIWMIAGHSEVWLMLNSVSWHAAAVALLSYGAGRLHGRRVGLVAGLLLAVSPAASLYADQVRMYAFLMFLIVWVWYAQARWLEGRAGRFGALWLVVSQVAVTSSHTAGLFMLSGCVLLGGLTVVASGRRERMLRWAVLESSVCALSLPAIMIGTLRDVSHLRAPNAGDVFQVWAFLAGAGSRPTAIVAAAPILGVLLLGVLLVGATRDRRLALPIATLVFAPLLIVAVASHGLRPIWIERIFVPVIPFVCLALARVMLGRGLPARVGVALVLLMIGGWGAVAVCFQQTRQKGDGFRPAAAAVRDGAGPDDLVLVDGTFSYWCFLWYFAGSIAIEPRHAYLLSNPAWDQLMHRLPTAVTALLDMSDADAVIRTHDTTVALLDRRVPPPPTAGDVFVVRRSVPVAELPGRRLAGTTPFGQVFLERWTIHPRRDHREGDPPPKTAGAAPQRIDG